MKKTDKRKYNEPPPTIPVYSKKYKIHTVDLYNHYQSCVKTRRALEKEAREEKWPWYDTPAPATIMKWVRLYDPSVDNDDYETDPVKAADIEMLGIIKIMQRKIRTAIGKIEFRDMKEVLAAIKIVHDKRKEITTQYKNDRSVGVQADKIAAALKVERRKAAVINNEMRDAAMAAIEEFEPLDHNGPTSFVEEKRKRRA